MGKSLRLYRSICANAGIDGITQDVANRRCVPLCPTAGQFPLLGQMNGDAVRPHIPMKKLISCAFNIDTACVELHFTDGSIYSINCTAVENEVADNRFQRAELDYLIYNDPLAYADLVLNGDVEAYLNAVTEYQTYEK